MPDDTSPDNAILDFSHAGLLITAHGSPSTSGGRASSRKHAQTIRGLDLFADVQTGFLTEKPFVKDVLDAMIVPEVYVVPNLACAGYISTNKLPQALSLTGQVTERITPQGHQRVFLTDPVGTDPHLPKMLATRIDAAIKDLDVDADEAAIVLIGHGSQKSRASFEHTEQIARDLNRQNLGAPLATAYLEEPPYIKDWTTLTQATTVVFVPFLISDGYHGANEIPQDIGFDPKGPGFQDRLAQVQPNVMERNGRRLIYLPPIGDAPEMSELILNRARAAKSEYA